MSILAPIDMEVFQNAIHAWFEDVTDLQTIWMGQSATQPCYPYGALQITSGPIPASPQWEERFETVAGQPAGQEIKMTVCNQCTFEISCQAYVGLPESRDPALNAQWYLNKAQSSLSLPSVRADFIVHNIAYTRTSPVQNINEVIADAFVSRANIDVTFGAVLSLDEYTGYVEKTEITSVSLGIDQEFGVT